MGQNTNCDKSERVNSVCVLLQCCSNFMQCSPQERTIRSVLHSFMEPECSLPFPGCGSGRRPPDVKVVRMRTHQRSSRSQVTRDGSPIGEKVVWAGGLLAPHRKNKSANYEILYGTSDLNGLNGAI